MWRVRVRSSAGDDSGAFGDGGGGNVDGRSGGFGVVWGRSAVRSDVGRLLC